MAASTSGRAPNGTKGVAAAFFTALEALPEDKRKEVAKAALSAIREKIAQQREKERAKKATAKTKAPRRSAARKTRGASTRSRRSTLTEGTEAANSLAA